MLSPRMVTSADRPAGFAAGVCSPAGDAKWPETEFMLARVLSMTAGFNLDWCQICAGSR